MNPPAALLNLRRTLVAIILVLVFEGLARKLQIPFSSIPIFFVKDVLVLILGLQLAFLRQPRALQPIWLAYVAAVFFFIPVFISTLLHDPILAIFGLKEYLLYPVVALGFVTAFEHSPLAEVIRLARGTALLVIPTTIIAVVQQHLPPDHWLNLSVEGDALGNFSSGGHLRVSSTFSFVAQYSAFLNFALITSVISLYRIGELKFLVRWLFFALVPTIFICSYITGSRGAVMGNLGTLAIALGLIILRMDLQNTMRIIGIGIGIFVVIFTLQFFDPDLFTTYSVREQGQLVGVSNEIEGRVLDSFFGWTNGVIGVPFLGYGIGVMSNGSDLFSDYADIYRAKGEWTETDFATTLFEGGPYLIVVWYGFRYFVIFDTIRRFLSRLRGDIVIPAAFCQGFIVLVGLLGTLAIQPPIAIWWWLGVGLSLTFWLRSIDPLEEGVNEDKPAAPTANPGKIRGRSAYADKLHGSRRG